MAFLDIKKIRNSKLYFILLAVVSYSFFYTSTKDSMYFDKINTLKFENFYKVAIHGRIGNKESYSRDICIVIENDSKCFTYYLKE